MPPEISVIIPTYNRAKLLASRSVPSVLAQSYKDFECIIVDDHSSDNTREVMEKLKKKDSRIRCFYLPENRRTAAAINYGIKQSRGKYIVILDHDNAFLPDFLKKTVGKIKELASDFGAVGCGARIVYSNGTEITYMPKVKQSIYTSLTDGWLFRKEIFSKGGLFLDERISSEVDSDLGIRFFEKYKVEVINEVLMLRYVRADIFEKDGLSAISGIRLEEQRLFLSKHYRTIEGFNDNKESAFLYRRAGRIFLMGDCKKEGISFLYKALKKQPSLRNSLHLLLAILGTGVYKKFFYFERLFANTVHSIKSRFL